jgi:hypothetical protein
MQSSKIIEKNGKCPTCLGDSVASTEHKDGYSVTRYLCTTTEPVSLMKCISALQPHWFGVGHKEFIQWAKPIVKAVLDSAGVEYVE